MSRRIMLYLCDPEKNIKCERTYCKHNPKAEMRECDGTSREEYARLDAYGKPIVLFDSELAASKKLIVKERSKYDQRR